MNSFFLLLSHCSDWNPLTIWWMCIYALFAIVSPIIWKCRHVFIEAFELCANLFLSLVSRSLAEQGVRIQFYINTFLSANRKNSVKKHHSIPLQLKHTFWTFQIGFEMKSFLEIFSPVVLLLHTLQKFPNWTTSSLINIRWHFQFSYITFSKKKENTHERTQSRNSVFFHLSINWL